MFNLESKKSSCVWMFLLVHFQFWISLLGVILVIWPNDQMLNIVESREEEKTSTKFLKKELLGTRSIWQANIKSNTLLKNIQKQNVPKSKTNQQTYLQMVSNKPTLWRSWTKGDPWNSFLASWSLFNPVNLFLNKRGNIVYCLLFGSSQHFWRQRSWPSSVEGWTPLHTQNELTNALQS